MITLNCKAHSRLCFTVLKLCDVHIVLIIYDIHNVIYTILDFFCLIFICSGQMWDLKFNTPYFYCLMYNVTFVKSSSCCIIALCAVDIIQLKRN